MKKIVFTVCVFFGLISIAYAEKILEFSTDNIVIFYSDTEKNKRVKLGNYKIIRSSVPENNKFDLDIEKNIRKRYLKESLYIALMESILMREYLNNVESVKNNYIKTLEEKIKKLESPKKKNKK